MKTGSKPLHLRKISAKETRKSSGNMRLEDDNISEEVEPLETTHTKEQINDKKEAQIEKTTFNPISIKPTQNYKPVFAKPMLNKKPFGKPVLKPSVSTTNEKSRESQSLLPRRSYKQKEQVQEDIPFSQMFGIQPDEVSKDIEPTPPKILHEAIIKTEEKIDVHNKEKLEEQTPEKRLVSSLAQPDPELLQEIKNSAEKEFWGDNGGDAAEVIDFDDLQF